jgi:hypothetical protein
MNRVIPPSRQIGNLTKRLPEIGAIKMGDRDKGKPKQARSGETYYLPMKRDSFMIVKKEKDINGFNVPDLETLEKLGVEVCEDDGGNYYTDPPITELEIMFPFNDPGLIFHSSYRLYAGRELICAGDGAQAVRRLKDDEAESGFKIDTEQPCTCDLYDPMNELNNKTKCKMFGLLKCVLVASPKIGGVYSLRTTGYNSITAIQTVLDAVSDLTQGNIAGIRFKLQLTMQKPTTGNFSAFPVATLLYDGGIKGLLADSKEVKDWHSTEIITHERKLLSEPIIEESEDEASDTAEEFYSDNVDLELDFGNDKNMENGSQNNAQTTIL